MTVLKEINFSLAQPGYPDKPLTLSEAAPGAEKLTGVILRRIIREKAQNER